MHERRRGPNISTFSIAARDPDNGDLGVAVASKFLAVGAVVPWVEAEVGAMAIQAHPDLTYGPRGLAMMRGGASAADTLGRLIAADPDRAIRQVGVVDAAGGVAAHSGESCIPWAGKRTGGTYTCQGNILTGAETLDAMAATFEATGGELSARLVAALSAGDRDGGDSRGRQGAAVFVVRKDGGYAGSSDVLVDLRVDDAADPCAELRRLYKLHQLHFGSSPEAEKLKIEGELAKELQTLLVDAGYHEGAPGGSFDRRSREALERLVNTENFEERIDLERLTIDPPALAFLRDRFGAGTT